jgi:hypothetical protein
VSRPDDLAGLAEVIASIRTASRNKNLLVTVDGAPFIERPDWVSTIGADAVATRGGERGEGVSSVEDRDQQRVARS